MPEESSKQKSVREMSFSSFTDWKAYIRLQLKQLSEDNVVIVSAGVAFFFFLALFPAIAGTVSLLSVFEDTREMKEQIKFLADSFPSESKKFFEQRLEEMISSPNKKSGWKFALNILLSIWVANIGTRALFKGISIAYNSKVKRNFIKENLVTLTFTVSGIVFQMLMIVLLVGFPILTEEAAKAQILETILSIALYPIEIIILTIALSLTYKFASYKQTKKIKHTLAGAIAAAVLWVICSSLLSFLLRTIGIHSDPYGSSASIIFLMLWCLLTSFIILLGAEINSLIIRDRADEGEK